MLDHKNILKKGVLFWNQWRIDNPSIKPELIGANLSELNLRGINFKNANISKAQFKETSLEFADLREANFEMSIFVKTNFIGANLENAFFNKAKGLPDWIEKGLIQGFYLQKNLIHSIQQGFNRFECVTFYHADLTGLELVKNSFYKCCFLYTKLDKTKLNKTNWYKTIIAESSFIETDFRESVFNQVHFISTILNRAIFSNTKLLNAYLDRVNFEDSQLNNMSVYNSELINVNFSNSDLTGVLLLDKYHENVTFKNIQCDYLYSSQKEKIPLSGFFQEAEFEKLYETELTNIDFLNIKIYISCNKEDQATALKIFNDLRSVPTLTPWLNKQNLITYSQLDSDLLIKTEESTVIIIAILSINSLKKKFVKEILSSFLFSKKKLQIIPVKIDNCTLNNYFLKSIIDLNIDWDKGIRKILKKIGIDDGSNLTICSNRVSSSEIVDRKKLLEELSIKKIVIEVGNLLIPFLDEEIIGGLFNLIKIIQHQFAYELGILLPHFHVYESSNIKPFEYRVLIKESEVDRYEIQKGRLLAIDNGLLSTELEGIPTKEPASDLPAIWILPSLRTDAVSAGYNVINIGPTISSHLKCLIRKHLDEFLGVHETKFLLDNLAKTHPLVVKDLITRRISVNHVKMVLQNLLKEGVSIKSMLTIIETITDHAKTTQDPSLLTEYVRQKLHRIIMYPYLSEDNRLPVITMSKGVEIKLLNSLQQTENGSYLSIEPSLENSIMESVQTEVENVMAMGFEAIILCKPSLRRHLKQMIELSSPSPIMVLSKYELPSGIQYKSLGIIKLNNE